MAHFGLLEDPQLGQALRQEEKKMARMKDGSENVDHLLISFEVVLTYNLCMFKV